MAKYVGDLEKTCSADWRKCLAKYVGDLEKTCLAVWRKHVAKYVGNLEKLGRRSYGDFVLEFAME